jgi:hypothetical protein
MLTVTTLLGLLVAMTTLFQSAHTSLTTDIKFLSVILDETGASNCFSVREQGGVPSTCATVVDKFNCTMFKNNAPRMTVSCGNDSITAFSMRNLNVSGTIPTQIGFLTSLSILSIASCDVRGTIPSQFGSLSKLQQLRLFENSLGGTLPRQFAALTNLNEIYIDHNQFSGPLGALPSSIVSGSCTLQTTRDNERSCFDCATIPANLAFCSCSTRRCDAQTVVETTRASTISSVIIPTVTMTVFQTTITRTSLTPQSSSTTNLPNTTATSIVNTTSDNLNTTKPDVAPSTDAGVDRSGMIVGAAVGGSIAILMLVGLAVFLVYRARRKKSQDDVSMSPPSTAATSATQIYTVIPSSPTAEYDVGRLQGFTTSS